jgi:glycosyltransferase involved in cell wall biosynthesis
VSARRVVHFTDSAGFGGAERQILTLIEHLDRGRWDPVLAHHGSLGIQPLVDGARALGVPDVVIPPMPDGVAGAPRVPATARRLRGLGADVLHAHLTWPLAAKWPLAAGVAARLPAVLATVQLYLPFEATRATLLQHRVLSRRVGRYICVSRFVADACISHVGWPAGRVSVVHNGIDPAPWEHGDAQAGRSALGAGEAPVALTLARLDPQKGLEVLVEAAARTPGVRFAIAGEGPERPALEAQIARLELADRVTLLGRREDAPDLLAGCDLFVLPSRFEGLPVSVVEAMAASRPVVATAIGGTDEAVVEGETGLLVPAGDAAALAAAVGRIASDGGLRDAMGAAGRERALAAFTAAEMARAVEATYVELLGKRA